MDKRHYKVSDMNNVITHDYTVISFGMDYFFLMSGLFV